MIVPLAVHGELLGDLELVRSEPFHRWDHMRATVLADFAARAVENSRLLEEARDREAERERLTERLITAEQDERRRLSLFLHDGPLQSMSGIALMHDAAIAAIEDGRPEDAEKVMRNSLEKERDTIRVLRDLSFAIEPLVLRDAGFFAAVRALGDQIETSHRITVLTDVEAGERLGEKTQVALYQIIRESLNQAVRRRPLKIEVAVREREDGGFEAEIADDGVEERRRASIEAIDERVKILNGRLSIDSGEHGGTLVRVVVPPYVAAARERLDSAPMADTHLLFVSKPSGYELVEREGEPPAAGAAVELGRGPLHGLEGRPLAAPGRRAALRVPPGRLDLAERVFGRGLAEDERGGERARPAARGDTACVGARDPEAVGGAAALVDPDPAQRRRDRGDDLDPGGAVTALDRSAGLARRLDDLADGALPHALPERLVGNQVPGAGAGLARRPLDDVEVGPVLRPEPLAAGVLDDRVAGVDLRQPHEVLGLEARRGGEVPAVELLHARRRARRRGPAPGAGRRRCSTGSRGGRAAPA